jgi:hypothetical protein
VLDCEYTSMLMFWFQKRKQTVQLTADSDDDQEVSAPQHVISSHSCIVFQDAAPAPKRRTATAKPSYKEESSISEDSRPKKQALGERSDITNAPASKPKPVKEAPIKKKLPSTIVEESEEEAPPKAGKASTAKPSAVEDENSASKAAGGEKKKKRKLGALLGGTTFTWDQTLVS